MTLMDLQKLVYKLMKNPKNHHKEIIGDVKPGLKVTQLKLYGKHFIAIHDEREKSE